MSEETYLYDVSVDNGKYTFRLDTEGKLTCARHGEPWWNPTEGSKAIISLMDGEEKRQNAVKHLLEAIVQMRFLSKWSDARDVSVESVLETLQELLGVLSDDHAGVR